MTYFLDFDRTLFDVEAFIEFLYQHPGVFGLSDLTYEEFKVKVGERISAGEITFESGELTRFLYNDAETFLFSHPDSVIITRGISVPLQKAKVQSAFKGDSPVPVLFTGELLKGVFLKHMQPEHPFVFIDDDITELNVMKDEFPDATLYEMRRDGKNGSGVHSVIHSLKDLPL